MFMNIGIDIDDTIMDTFDYLMPYVAKFFNADINELKNKNISYSNLPKEWKAKELDFCKRYYDTVAPYTPVKPDAADYIKKIKELGHSIFIITARDNRLYTDAYKTTSQQLSTSGILYDKLICTFDKSQTCIDEKISLFIDDSVENCKKVKAAKIPVLLFGSKGNASINTDLTKVNAWKEIYEIIKKNYDIKR